MPPKSEFDMQAIKQAQHPRYRELYAKLNDLILDGDVEEFGRALQAAGPDARFACLTVGKDSNMLAHRIATGIPSNPIAFLEKIRDHAGPESLFSPNVKGELPLLVATEFSVPQVMSFLVEQGADPNACNLKGAKHNMCTLACSKLNFEIFEHAILIGCDPHRLNAAGIGPATAARDGGMTSDQEREFTAAMNSRMIVKVTQESELVEVARPRL